MLEIQILYVAIKGADGAAGQQLFPIPHWHCHIPAVLAGTHDVCLDPCALSRKAHCVSIWYIHVTNGSQKNRASRACKLHGLRRPHVWPGQVVRALTPCGWLRLLGAGGTWETGTVSVLTQMKRASKASCHQLTDGVPASGVIVKLQSNSRTALAPFLATISHWGSFVGRTQCTPLSAPDENSTV